MDEREEYLVKRIKELEAKLEKAEAGTKEIMELVDAMMVQVAMVYGTEEDGAHELRLPEFIAGKLLAEWEVQVRRDELSREYVIRARRREA